LQDDNFYAELEIDLKQKLDEDLNEINKTTNKEFVLKINLFKGTNGIVKVKFRQSLFAE
jgi:hypothetical protein